MSFNSFQRSSITWIGNIIEWLLAHQQYFGSISNCTSTAPESWEGFSLEVVLVTKIQYSQTSKTLLHSFPSHPSFARSNFRTCWFFMPYKKIINWTAVEGTKEFTSSTVPVMIYRITLTSLSWPSRWIRAMAWLSTMGFHWGSRR